MQNITSLSHYIWSSPPFLIFFDTLYTLLNTFGFLTNIIATYIEGESKGIFQNRGGDCTYHDDNIYHGMSHSF